MKIIRKIHIIGAAGSGKTYTSINLSKVLNVSPCELDKLFWDKTDKFYDLKSPQKVREKELNQLLILDSWIIEGVYYEWVLESFEKADLIIFLKPSFMLCTFRIIIRFIKEKIGLINCSKKETFIGLIQMIRRNHRYYKVCIPEILTLLSPYNSKLKKFFKGDEAIDYVNNLFKPVSDNTSNVNLKKVFNNKKTLRWESNKINSSFNKHLISQRSK
ncbi:MAG: hypothetical protein NTX03_02140 [Bacteroidetes bacterium]|nr:hypothetical protein [Bacteroidota bacterium]